MKDIKITTKIAFALLRLIKNMGLKERIIKISKEQMKLTAKQQELYRDLYSRNEDKGEDITPEVASRLLNEYVDLSKEITDIDITLNDIGLEFAYDVIEKLEEVEKEFNKTMAVIFGVKEKEIEEKEIDEVIEMIMNIFKSKSFQGLFNKMNK
ncbi:hypothetical protein [Paraclostridium bifermentans]|uniref:hypothetical protein n=1 Tax=Paraclostridium bifermentans TaxID=1490 RepID=UPI0029125632|nr:hypothetical protein [Paraclostridium bifermentans]MDU3337958.1 hypothetical protein [Paraclostridium bifermentans]